MHAERRACHARQTPLAYISHSKYRARRVCRADTSEPVDQASQFEVIYRDRFEAGTALAELVSRFSDREDAVVLALPRGGVPIGYQIAKRLRVPLDVFVVRKLGVPFQPELAMGAIATGGIRVLNDSIVRELGIPPEVIDAVAKKEEQELQRRERDYRGDRPALQIRGKTLILVDDGLATGTSMRSAVEALRQQGPARLIVAVPVASRETCESFQNLADEVICAATPMPFVAVGQWYTQFDQTSDAEVRELLARAERERTRTAA
jgi:predicted phosphoribosyltransferase